MAKNKTTETSSSVEGFIDTVQDETKRDDSFRLIDVMKKQTGYDPKMWGPSIIGFGSYHYKYESGREGDAPIAAFSPRKSALVIYFYGGFEQREQLLAKLGKHKTEKGCVYIKKLDDINLSVLQQMIANQIKHIQKLYPNQS